MNLKQRWLEMLIKWCMVNQKEHAWHTAKELEKMEFGLFDGIAGELEKTMKQLNAQQRKNGG